MYATTTTEPAEIVYGNGDNLVIISFARVCLFHAVLHFEIKREIFPLTMKNCMAMKNTIYLYRAEFIMAKRVKLRPRGNDRWSNMFGSKIAWLSWFRVSSNCDSRLYTVSVRFTSCCSSLFAVKNRFFLRKSLFVISIKFNTIVIAFLFQDAREIQMRSGCTTTSCRITTSWFVQWSTSQTPSPLKSSSNSRSWST